MVKGMRETAIEDFDTAIDNRQRYNEGMKEGFRKGYDRAMEDMQGILKKYHVGVEKPESQEEKELKPAVHFLGNSMKSLIDKIVEECDEVVQAYNDGEGKGRLAEEIADVQLACETALTRLGFCEKERREIRLANIQKNDKRGYYDA
jgi:phosphoribosyl-ATP pyrophosphohydrolase